MRSHLNPGGALIISVGHIPNSGALEQVVTATLRSVFPVVIRDRFSPTNSLVVASTGALSSSRLIAAAGTPPRISAGSRSLRAPVEWLTDLSILRYAAGAR